MNAGIETVGIIHSIDIAYDNGDNVSFFTLTVLLQLLLLLIVSFKNGYVYINLFIYIYIYIYYQLQNDYRRALNRENIIWTKYLIY